MAVRIIGEANAEAFGTCAIDTNVGTRSLMDPPCEVVSSSFSLKMALARARLLALTAGVDLPEAVVNNGNDVLIEFEAVIGTSSPNKLMILVWAAADIGGA